MTQVNDVKRIDKLTYYNPRLDQIQGLNGRREQQATVRLQDYLENMTIYEKELEQKYTQGKVRERIYVKEKESVVNKEQNFLQMYKYATPYIQYVVEQQYRQILQNQHYYAYYQQKLKEEAEIALQNRLAEKRKQKQKQPRKSQENVIEAYRNDVAYDRINEGKKLPPIMDEEHINFIGKKDILNRQRMEKLVRLYQYWLVYCPNQQTPVIQRLCLQEYNGETLLYMQLKNQQGFYCSPKGLYDRANGRYTQLSLRDRYHNEYLFNFFDNHLNGMTEEERRSSCLQGLNREEIVEIYELMRIANVARIKLLKEQVCKLARKEYSETANTLLEDV